MPTETKSPSASARRAQLLTELLARHRTELQRQARRHAPRPATSRRQSKTQRAEDCAAELAAIDRLRPDERTALLLLGLGYSYREIAETQGWT